MIRLLVAIVVGLALHPAAAGAHARGHGRGHGRGHEATIAGGGGGGDRATMPLGDAQLHGVAGSVVAALAPPRVAATALVAPRSFRAVARLWLRAQRLLC